VARRRVGRRTRGRDRRLGVQRRAHNSEYLKPREADARTNRNFPPRANE
jgi:hypothetical protein